MARFDRQIATAQRLIKKNGQQCIYRQVRDGAPADPTKPWVVGPNVDIDHPGIWICFIPETRQDRQFLTYMLGREVPTGMTLALMGQVPFEPKAKDVIIRDGVEYRTKTINNLAPNGQQILYTLEFEV